MKIFFTLSILIFKLSALTLQNFNASFKQIITDEYNKTIGYSGLITAQTPSNVVYHYTSPMKKSLFLLDKKIIIVEDELEQIIVRRLKSEINLFELLKNAKENDNGTFTSKYKGFTFYIKKKNNLPKSIKYSDELDNTIQIEFFNIKTNIKLDKDTFKPNIPPFYDVIKE